MSELGIYSWFNGDERVSIYSDGSVEIQALGTAYRGNPRLWIRAATELNYSVSHCQADLIAETPSQGGE